MLEFFFNEDSGKLGVPHWKCVLLCVYVCVCVCVCVWRVEVGKGEIEDVLKILDNEIVCIFLLGGKDRKNWQERVAC